MFGFAVAADILCAHGFELVVTYGQEDGVVGTLLWSCYWGDAVFMFRFCRIDPGVVDIHFNVVLLQFSHHIHHTGVTQVRAVFLEGKAHDQHPGPIHLDAAVEHGLYQFAGHVAAHAVVDAAAREDDFRVVADGLGLVGKVVGVYADAVPTHQAGPERQEVPFGAGSLQDCFGVDAHAAEDHGKLVY